MLIPRHTLTAITAASASVATPILKGQLTAEDEAFVRRQLRNSKRDNACSPELYWTPYQDVYDCPHKYTLNSNGDCISGIPPNPADHGCVGYCEIKQTFIYGTEAPFPMPPCATGDGCTLTTGYSVANTTSISFNIGINSDNNPGSDGLKLAFNAGATYQWSQTVTSSVTETHNKPVGEQRCGYFTFVPFEVTSCGSLTTSYAVANVDSSCEGMGCTDNADDPMQQVCDTSSDIQTTPNYCNTTPILMSNGQTLGKIIYVATGCDGGAPYSDGQDPIYYNQGVSGYPGWSGDASSARTPTGTPDGNGANDPPSGSRM